MRDWLSQEKFKIMKNKGTSWEHHEEKWTHNSWREKVMKKLQFSLVVRACLFPYILIFFLFRKDNKDAHQFSTLRIEEWGRRGHGTNLTYMIRDTSIVSQVAKMKKSILKGLQIGKVVRIIQRYMISYFSKRNIAAQNSRIIPITPSCLDPCGLYSVELLQTLHPVSCD